MTNPNSETLWDILRANRADAPIFKTAADLGRHSMERMHSLGLPIQVSRSSGRLRLTGDAVRGVEAPVASVGQIMIHLQKFVSAAGAASEGITALRGKLPSAIEAKSRLNLNASPQPGSVILTFTSASDPLQELTNEGMSSLLQEDEQTLIDATMIEVISGLRDGLEQSRVGNNERFVEHVAHKGPRFASSLRSLMKVVSDHDFNFELSWAQPMRPVQHLELKNSEAKFIEGLVSGRELDIDSTILNGVLRTVSDLKSLALETEKEGLLSIGLGDLERSQLKEFHVGEVVRIDAKARSTVMPGGDLKLTYTAERISHKGA